MGLMLNYMKVDYTVVLTEIIECILHFFRKINNKF